MKLELELNGVRTVAGVRRQGDGWVVTLDGREVTASLAAAGGRWSLLLGRGDAAAAGLQARGSYDVSIEPRPDGLRIVRVDGTPVAVSVIDPRTFRRLVGGPGRAAGSGPAAVVAPMPGRIVKILVQPGDEVAAHQAVVVIEAMKMENELRAARAGIVAEVRVVQGASVEAHAVLVVLE